MIYEFEPEYLKSFDLDSNCAPILVKDGGVLLRIVAVEPLETTGQLLKRIKHSLVSVFVKRHLDRKLRLRTRRVALALGRIISGREASAKSG